MIERAGVMDVISISAQHDTCLVLPTLRHAIALWPRYFTAVEDRHVWAIGGGHRPFKATQRTKTAIVMTDTKTALRLWVPYQRDPTMPMDWEINRRHYILISPYSRRDVLA